MYVPETNVLLTRWLGEENSAEVIDLMPIPEETGAKPSLVRRIEVTRGKVSFRLHCWPRFDYARRKPKVTIDGPIVHFSCGDFTLRLCGDLDFVEEDGGVTANVTLMAGEKLDLVLDDDARTRSRNCPTRRAWTSSSARPCITGSPGRSARTIAAAGALPSIAPHWR